MSEKGSNLTEKDLLKDFHFFTITRKSGCSHKTFAQYHIASISKIN